MLIIAFGSLVAAGLPLLAGVAALVTAFGVLGAASYLTSFDVFVQAVVTMIGRALGIDYCLFAVTRRRAELAAHPGRAIADTVGATIATAGKAVLFSGSTVLISVAGLLLVRTPVFRTMAIGVMVAVAVMLAITVTLLPAVLALLGERINRLAVPGDAACGRWELRFALAALDGPGHAPPGAHRRRRETGPAPGRRDPIQVVATQRPAVPGWGRSQALGRPAERALSRRPGRPAERRRPDGVRQERRRLPGGHRTGPLDPGEAVPEATPPGGPEIVVGGLTAQTVDVVDEVDRATPWVLAAVLGLSFVLLLLAFRSLPLPLSAIVMNLLSVGAAFGLLTWVFQDGPGETLLDFSSRGFIQTYLPLLTFVVLFGLSMDYEVFLISRMKVEWTRTRDNRAAVTAGLVHTADVITAAAAIMIVVFGAFMITNVVEVKQMGLALAVAVAVDATLIRIIVVPALMRLAGRAI